MARSANGGGRSVSLGIDRERQVRDLLRAEGYWVIRAAGSYGDAVLLAIAPEKAYRVITILPLLVEVKATRSGPYKSFGPKERAEMRAVASYYPFEPMLCWWPPYHGPFWIPEDEWPS
jgi:hypothetical protein